MLRFSIWHSGFTIAGPASFISLDVRPSTPHDVDGLRSLIRILVSYSLKGVKSKIGAYVDGVIVGPVGFGMSFSNSVAILAKNVFRQFALSISLL